MARNHPRRHNNNDILFDNSEDDWQWSPYDADWWHATGTGRADTEELEALAHLHDDDDGDEAWVHPAWHRRASQD